MTTVKLHECAPENAATMREWINSCGGVAVWPVANLSNIGVSWSTPALTTEGQPMRKPTWEAAEKPTRIITDASQILVVERKEYKRFHVAIRRGSQGMMYKLTDASSRRVRASVDKAGEGASYHFDYDTQEAVITVPGSCVLLSEWKDPNEVCDAPQL